MSLGSWCLWCLGNPDASRIGAPFYLLIELGRYTNHCPEDIGTHNFARIRVLVATCLGASVSRLHLYENFYLTLQHLFFLFNLIS